MSKRRPNGLSDHQLIVASLHGELGDDAQFAARSAIRAAEDLDYIDDEPRVADALRAALDD